MEYTLTDVDDDDADDADGCCDGQTIERQTMGNLQGIQSCYLITLCTENCE